jgi:tripartite-type tricarboxylate transporter receptor subunit TctC
LLCVAFLALANLAGAQGYPDKAVKIIEPYAVGGSTDATARLVAKSLSAKIGQPVVVENRAGAGGSLGHDIVAKAPADDYTLLFSAAARRSSSRTSSRPSTRSGARWSRQPGWSRTRRRARCGEGSGKSPATV